MTFRLKRGDTKARDFDLTYAGGKRPVDLTNATTIRYLMAPAPGGPAATLVNATVVVVGAPTSGRVRWTPQASHVALAGIYRAEVEVTWNDASKETFPEDGWLDVVITADLGP